MACASSKETLNLIGRENGQSKSSALIKGLTAVNKFYLSTEIRLIHSNESSLIQSGDMKRRATSEKHRKTVVNILKGAQLIIQEVLTNNRVMGN